MAASLIARHGMDSLTVVNGKLYELNLCHLAGAFAVFRSVDRYIPRRASKALMILNRLCMITSAAALVAALAAIAVSISNQWLQQQIAQRQQVINEGLTLSQINRRLANSFAVLATSGHDDKARHVLAEHALP